MDIILNYKFTTSRTQQLYKNVIQCLLGKLSLCLRNCYQKIDEAMSPHPFEGRLLQQDSNRLPIFFGPRNPYFGRSTQFFQKIMAGSSILGTDNPPDATSPFPRSYNKISSTLADLQVGPNQTVLTLIIINSYAVLVNIICIYKEANNTSQLILVTLLPGQS